MVAFLLNIAAVFLVSAGSGLVLTLAGVFKDILLITGSVLIFGAQITPLQVIGGFITSIIARVNLNRFMMCRVLDRPRRPYPVQDRRQQVNTHDESCVWLVLGAWALITDARSCRRPHGGSWIFEVYRSVCVVVYIRTSLFVDAYDTDY